MKGKSESILERGEAMSYSEYDLPPERREEMIEWVAQQIHKRGLTTPAVFFIEMNRPISYIGSQAVHFFSPFINAIFDSKLASEVGTLMADRKNIDRLIDRLEMLAREDEMANLRAKRRARQVAKGGASPEAVAIEEAAQRSGVELTAGEATTGDGAAPKRGGLLGSVKGFFSRKK